MKINTLKFVFASLMAAIILSSCTNGVKLSDGLVLYSDFENGADDKGPLGRNGVLIGAVLSDDCAVGKHAVYLDGEDDYISYPSSEVYFNGDYSISIWCKWVECHLWDRILDFNQDKPMSGNSVTWLIGRPAEGTENNMWFDQWVNYDGIFVESILDQRNVPADACLGYNVELDKWCHYVIVYDSSASNPNGVSLNYKGECVPYEGIVTLYVDGIKVGANDHCEKPQDAATIANWLGRSRFAPDPYYKGFMDDFRIYDRCLSEKEVLALYNLKNK